MARLLFAFLPLLASVAAAAEEPSTAVSEVARAQEAETDARQRAEDALKAMRDYVKAASSLAHNDSAIAELARGVEAHVGKEFKDRREQISSRLREIDVSIHDIRGKANQTADDEAHVEALRTEAQTLEAEQEKLDVNHEIKEMFRMSQDVEAHETRLVKAMEEDGKHAAKEWKSAAKATEHAKRAAGASEREYEGEYEDTERLTERMHDRFQDEKDAASDAIEDVYESVAKRLDHRADELRDGRASEEEDAQAQPLAFVLVDKQAAPDTEEQAEQHEGAEDEEQGEEEDPVSEAESEEAAAKKEAEDAYARMQKREADLRATLHDDAVLDRLAQQAKNHVHPDFAAQEDDLRRQMREAREERDAILANPNRTAEDLKHARALDATLGHRRDELHDARKKEMNAMHEFCEERELAEKHDARELRSTAKDAATAWKHAARRTEHARREADMSERVYEGEFQKAESSSERMHDRAENVGDDAANWVEKIYDAVWKRLERDSRETESADDAAAPKADFDVFPAPSSDADAAQHGEQGSAGNGSSQAAAVTREQAHGWTMAAAPVTNFSSLDGRGPLAALACFTMALFLANVLGLVQLRWRCARRAAAQGGWQALLAEESV